MTRILFTAGLVTATALHTIPASGQAQDPPPSRITQLSASVGNGHVSVQGAASFGGQPLLTVATDPTNDQVAPASGSLGFDYTRASIGQPDASTGDFTAILSLADLPPAGAPGLGFYAWYFAVKPDGPGFGTLYSIRGRLESTGPVFNLWICGNDLSPKGEELPWCGLPVPLVTEIVGSEIVVLIPWSVLTTRNGATLKGTKLVPATGLAERHSILVEERGTGQNIDTITSFAEYTVAYETVMLGIAPAGTSPEQVDFEAPATVNGDDSFSGVLSTAGLTSGTYEVWAKACYGTNCGVDRVAVNLAVNQPPSAHFTVSCVGTDCTFSGSASSDPDGQISAYAWSFGDGTGSQAGPSVQHTFPEGTGSYLVTLTVTDNRGATDNESRTVKCSKKRHNKPTACS